MLPNTQKYEHHIPRGFAYKIVCINDRFSKIVVLYSRKNQSIGSLHEFTVTVNIVEK